MIKYKKPQAILLHASPLALAEIAGRVCYDSFHLSENEIIKEFGRTNILTGDIEESKLVDNLVNVLFHESVSEHVNLSYFIKDISREIIIELNRHRIGIATSQKSSRYTIEKMIDAWVAQRDNLTDVTYKAFALSVHSNLVHLDPSLLITSVHYVDSMLKRYDQDEPLVSGLTGGAKKKQNDRVKRCLTESWMLEGVWTFNLRALKHLVELRTSGAAYPFIRELVEEILRVTPHKYRILVDKKYKKQLENTKK